MNTKKASDNAMGLCFFLYGLTFLAAITLIPGHWLIGFGVWVGFLSFTLGSFIIYVPEVTAFALHNKVKDNAIRAVDAGWKFKFPWEEVVRKISLKTVSGEFKETYNSEDGIDMPTKVGYEYQPDPDRINTFITIDNSVLERGLEGAISSCLSGIIAKQEAQTNREKVSEISKELLKRFEDINVQNLDVNVPNDSSQNNSNNDDNKSGIEKAFGIDVRLIQVEDINYPKEYREAKMAKSVAESNVDAAKSYQIDDSVSGKDALNFVQVQQGKSNKSIFDIEGLENFGESIGLALAKALSNPKGDK